MTAVNNRVKYNVSVYLPSLIGIVGDDLDWKRIDNLFTEKIEQRKRLAQGKPLMVEMTIYDMIVEVKKRNVRAFRLLDFLNKLFEELSSLLDDAEKKLIRKNIRGFLTTLDKGYLNYVGEIAVLNNLIKSKTYRLDNTEEPLPNNKSIDFKLRKTKEGASVLVEVVNLHLDSERVDTCEESIRKFLTDRLTRKIESKKKHLPGISFFLVPVLWGGHEVLKIYSDYFKTNTMHIENVIEPVAYLTFTNDSGSYVKHRFGNISNLFNRD